MKLPIYIFIISSLSLLSSCNFFASGSYPFAEYYNFNIGQKELAKKIKDFKSAKPQYKLIRTSSTGEEMEYPDEYSSNIYELYFYFTDTNQTIHCVIKKGDNNTGRIGLEALSSGTNFAGWKQINTKQLSKKENSQIKLKFEKEILNELGKWESKNNWKDFKKRLWGRK